MKAIVKKPLYLGIQYRVDHMNKCKSKQMLLCMAGIKITKGNNVSSNTKNVGTSLAITFVPIHIGHPVAGHHHYTLGTHYCYNKSDRKVTYTRNGSVISALESSPEKTFGRKGTNSILFYVQKKWLGRVQSLSLLEARPEAIWL